MKKLPMPPSLPAQIVLVIRHGIKAELADKERLISPVLFAVTVLLLFNFALGETDPGLKARLFVAETYLTAFFALQISFSRIFEPDREDRVFDLMRTYPLSHTAWFLGKYALVLILGSLVAIPTVIVSAFLLQDAGTSLFSWAFLGILGCALAGLAALGVVLSVLTLKAHARQILYPLLYFPLTAPVLLAGVQSSLLLLEAGSLTDSGWRWLTLLACFDVIYFTLGVLLFTELVDEG